MARYCLIHISDLHFASQPYIVNRWRDTPGDPNAKHSFRCMQTSHDEDAVRRLVDFLRTKCCGDDAADLVLISGDLASTGLRSHLEIAAGFILGPRYFSAEAQTYATHCGLPTQKLFIMPGNHDRYRPEHLTTRTLAEALEPGGVEFDRIFGRLWPAPGDQVTVVAAQSPEVGTAIRSCERKVVARRVPSGDTKGPSLYVVAADFCLVHEDDAEGVWDKRPWAYAGQGRALKAILHAMLTLTRKVQAEDEGAAVIWMVHFPPLLEAELSWDDRWLRLIGAKHVTKAAADSNVGVILSGHLHVDRMSKEGDAVQSWSTGTATGMSFTPPRSLHEIIVTTGTDGWVEAERHTYAYLPAEDGTGSSFKKPSGAVPRRHRWHSKGEKEENGKAKAS